MLSVTINGRQGEVEEGATILEALHAVGIEIPTLCHDDRLHPCGACRLCVVEIKGWNRHATACNTYVAQGMEILTHSTAVEGARRTLLRLLAQDCSRDAMTRAPEKPFHRWLHHYGILPGESTQDSLVPDGPRQQLPPFRDDSHPYIAVDMTQCITCYRCVRICEEVQGHFVWRAWDRGNQTRILPENAGPLVESTCVSCGACSDTCPTGALEDQSVRAHGAPTAWTRTTCPYCGTGCEMRVGTREGRITQVLPVLDAPVSKGHLCVKGRYAFGFNHAKDRMTEPMLRVGGAWQRVSWAEATAFIADRFRSILEEHGPDSIGVLGSARGTNEENYLAQKFARVVLGTNNVDCCARVCHAPTAAGMKLMLGTGAATNSFDDIEKASAFLICGCNPTENHPIVGARIKQAVLKGARLIVVDPREIELTQYADTHLQLHPGTNIPLLHALAHVILTEGLCDDEVLRERVADLEAYAEFIQAWTPERAAKICGVAAEQIRKAARLYADAASAMCFHGLGVTEHGQGTEGVMCLVNLALLTGNFGKPGSGVNPLRGQNNVQGSAHMGCEPNNLTGYVPLDQGRDIFEAVWKRPIPRKRGLNLMEMIDAAGEHRLHALWAIGYDVALTNPNAAATRASLGELDLVIVQDLFLNSLASEFAHVFLPASSSFEKDGTFMNSERRVQRVRKAVEPPGNARPDWRIICDIALAMGHAEQFRYTSAEDIWNEVRSVWKGGAGISYQRLDERGLQWPCPAEDHPGTPTLHIGTFPHGQRAPLKCVEFQASTETTTEDMPFLLTTGRTLFQFNAGTMTMRTPNSLLRRADTLDMAPADAGRLHLADGDIVRIRSRHGSAVLPLRISESTKPGELFATFHDSGIFLNNVTGPHRDRISMTPEYKVVAVSVEKEEVEPSVRPAS
jgi:formate dehydrogenase major subunit